MFNPLTKAQLGHIETDLIEIAKGALPPTKAEWKRYDELRDRDEYAQMSLPAVPPQWQELYGLTEAERAELDALSAKAEQLAMMPEESAAEEQLFAKYGPTTGTAVPRRAISTQQSITEKALAAAFYAHGRGIEQPFTERAGSTISLEEYERPRECNRDHGVGDEFEKAQEMGGAQTTGPSDG